MELSTAALGSPHLKGVTEGQVSDARKGVIRKMFLKAGDFSVREMLARLIWAPLFLCLVLVEYLKLVGFEVYIAQ